MNDPKANLELIKDFGINGYENIRSLAEINLRTWEKLVEKQMDAFGLFVDAGINQLAANKNPQDIKAALDNQIALGKSLSENIAVKGRETVDLANQAGNEYRSWLENGINTFNSKVNAAAGKAFKK
ncbi:MAG: phasin family protein [Sedimenticola sp.]|nr:phasin family protein [Sedimenticola sp.]MCW8883130.1 phasin family protein [Sedimenticola sp.]MCW8947988.1 phasin family protein [Sedimenticola sp.]MCW8976948.1 phasin family protein [Sedimenticola sp.]MCW9021742.1 phasin family protein [Sedimenticola sp.]